MSDSFKTAVDPLLRDLDGKKESFRRNVVSMAAELNQVKGRLVSQEQFFVKESLSRKVCPFVYSLIDSSFLCCCFGLCLCGVSFVFTCLYQMRNDLFFFCFFLWVFVFSRKQRQKLRTWKGRSVNCRRHWKIGIVSSKLQHLLLQRF